MNILRRMVCNGCACALALLACVRPGEASWSSAPDANVPVCAVPGQQQHAVLTTDSLGGTFIAWEDQRPDEPDGYGGYLSKVYVQRLLPSGDVAPGWPLNGIRMCTAPGSQTYVSLLADYSGGAYVLWCDSRPGAPGAYLQRITSSGQVAAGWPANGLQVMDKPKYPGLCSDGVGGVIVTACNYFSAYAQRVSQTGALLWNGGSPVLLSSAGSVPGYPSAAICSDGGGGALVGWFTFYDVFNMGVYAQHVTALGTIASGWPAQGDSLCSAFSNGIAYPPLIAADGFGGALLVFKAGSLSRGYALRVTGAGAVASGWPASGAPVTSPYSPVNGMSLAPDAAGGVYVGYASYPFGNTYVQHLGATGSPVPGWPVSGIQISDAGFLPGVAADGRGGVTVAWMTGSSALGVAATRLASGGSLALGWPAAPETLATHVLGGYDYLPLPVVADGTGGLVVAWMGGPAGSLTGQDIYAQRVGGNGRIGPEATISGVPDVPHDQGGHVLVQWTPSYLDAGPANTIAQYTVWRQIAASAAAALADGDAAAGPATSRRMRTTQPDGSAAYWDYLGAVPARRLAGYAYYAATTTDSVAGSNPRTSFMVVAEGAGGAPSWASAPDSGYSVDNLAPPAPAPFSATFVLGSGSFLSWGAGPDADLAGYRLYRGDWPGFTPAPGNLIYQGSLTSFHDPAVTSAVYKVSAYDDHGNEGSCSITTPVGTTGAGSAAAPTEVALALGSANPARSGAEFRVALPSGSFAELSIYDAGGRRVRQLLDGWREAGRISVRWDARDDAGRGVPSGVYFARLRSERCSIERRVLVAR